MANGDQIVTATPHELAGVLELDRLAPVGHDREAYLEARITEGQCVIALRDGTVVAYLIVRPRHFFGRDFVDLLAVAPHARRGGLATALLREAVDRATTPRLFCSTNASNAPMLALLDKERWTFAGSLEGIDQGDPEQVFFIETGPGR